jgi:hypothetical protein
MCHNRRLIKKVKRRARKGRSEESGDKVKEIGL